jgi:biotin carboxylase
MQRLVFIESNTSGTGRLFARAARAEGLAPLLLSDNPARYGYAAEDEIEVLEVDTQDEDALTRVCLRVADASGLAGVTTSSEYFIGTAASVARRLGLPGPDAPAVRACRDKHKQRRRLRAAGVGIPEFLQATTVKEALAGAETLGPPVVVKPVGGSGSVGVRLCTRAEEAAAHAARLLRQRRNERGMAVPRRVLIEAAVGGPEYSVETFSRRVVGVTRKHLGARPYFVEVGHDHPAELPEEEMRAVCDTALRALEALGLGWGPAHVELRFAADGPKIIEVNPRLAGGYIPELVRLARGVDLIAETIKLVAGRGAEVRATLARHSSIRFILPEQEGVLAGVDGIDEAAGLPGVVEVRLYLPVGSKLQLCGDFRDRVGHVLACGDDAPSVREAAEAGRDAVRLRVREP